MSTLAEAISCSKILMNGLVSNTGSRFKRPYIFANENLDDTATLLDYQNKSVLTVASSGDQALCAYSYGAKSVTVYDNNLLAYYVTYLKIAAVKCLSYSDFLAFFIFHENGVKNEQYFSRTIFERFAHVLPDDVLAYWEEIISAPTCRDQANMFNIGYAITPMHLSKKQFYKEPFYYRLQETLKTKAFPKFVLSSVTEFDSKVPGTFDVIYLSNILEWMIGETKDNKKEKRIDVQAFLDTQIYNKLFLGGKALTCYTLGGNALHCGLNLGELHHIPAFMSTMSSDVYIYEKKL